MKGLRGTKNALFSFLPINFLFRWLDSSTDWKPSREEKKNNNSDKKRNKTEQTLKLAVHCKWQLEHEI